MSKTIKTLDELETIDRELELLSGNEGSLMELEDIIHHDFEDDVNRILRSVRSKIDDLNLKRKKLLQSMIQ